MTGGNDEGRQPSIVDAQHGDAKAPLDGRLIPLPALAEIEAMAMKFAVRSKAARTVDLYRRSWDRFEDWCERSELQALPADPSTVSLYVTELATAYSVASIALAVASISQAHQAASYPSPTTSFGFRAVWRGIRRTLGVAPRRRAAALTPTMVRDAVLACPDTPLGLRDKALVLVLFCAALRRSELVALRRGDVRHDERGAILTVRRSKVDQEGIGREIALPYGKHLATCPVAALREWMGRGGGNRELGSPLLPRFSKHGGTNLPLSHGAVTKILRRCLARAGYDPEPFSSHSGRVGFVTAAAAAGATERAIARTTGHRSSAVLRGYIRVATAFDDAAMRRIDL